MMKTPLIALSIIVVVILIGVTAYSIPAALSLPNGPRKGIDPLTIAQAAQGLKDSGKTGWDLVEAARSLVEDRMQYCRRNSYQAAATAFERGFGYCQQQAFALYEILKQLGFRSEVVHAFRNKFPDGRVGGHAWVSVTNKGETRYVDTIHYDPVNRHIFFIPLTRVMPYTPLFRIFAGWGSGGVNAYRYYITGKDW